VLATGRRWSPAAALARRSAGNKLATVQDVVSVSARAARSCASGCSAVGRVAGPFALVERAINHQRTIVRARMLAAAAKAPMAVLPPSHMRRRFGHDAFWWSTALLPFVPSCLQAHGGFISGRHVRLCPIATKPTLSLAAEVACGASPLMWRKPTQPNLSQSIPVSLLSSALHSTSHPFSPAAAMLKVPTHSPQSPSTLAQRCSLMLPRSPLAAVTVVASDAHPSLPPPLRSGAH